MKKGFTLIELLAVIVILAIIALIATPVILGIINDAKRSAFKDSAYGIENAAELLYAKNLMEQKNSTIIFTYEDFVETSSPEGFSLNYKGEKPKNGQIVLEKDGTVRMSLHNGFYCLTKTSLTDVILEEKEIGDCSLPDMPENYRFLKDNSKAPAPELSDTMIAIARENDKWVKVDSNIQENWYNYEAKVWANAVTVTESSRNKYLSAKVGTEIKEEDILTYFVWIPRYKYKLFNVESDLIEPITIEVLFEDKNTSKSIGTKNGEYLTHPAFTFGNTELNGIWVGKFETTGSIDSPCVNESCSSANLTIKPNLVSVDRQTVSSMFYASRSMQKNGNIYGFTSSIDTHMMKNMEWGAVAYLTQSKYGKNSEVWINNYVSDIYASEGYTAKTGCVGNSVSEEKSDECQNTYDSKLGGNGSTTGNIYGIYDMSGGSWEQVMGVMYNSGDTTIMVGDSDFSQTTIDSSAMEKYLDKYRSQTDSSHWDSRILGDATGETWNWYSDHFDLPKIPLVYGPWIHRGGNFEYQWEAGIFYHDNISGEGLEMLSFRVVVTAS